MPMPRPTRDEDKETFVSRCMETLTKDEKERFPSREQRAAVCYSQWDEHQKKLGRKPETPEEKHPRKQR